MLCTSLRRIDAFEKDLEFYLGKDWKKTYVIRESVANYLNHLHYLADNNKILLLVYVYHLYMGLLSGGQILRKKRAYSILPKRTKTKNIPGEAVTDFEGANLYNLKKKLRDDMDNEARKFSEATKQLFITESKKLFLMNNKIIQSIEGAGKVVMRKFLKWLLILIVTGLIAYMLYKLIL
ncbi:heme oxygenase 2-like [Ctenocephalides felis]|uniref:heme oxygenase 2-like n=1 Tax=Ctenocephalides felis TaxID=7515 RepID=UPI000E6E392C|nr:heme oxygenase 2-like [Ctenocephalides felis]